MNDLKQVELTIEEAEKNIEKAEALTRLFANSDFKAIVEEGYFQDNSIALVRRLAFPQFDKPESQNRLQNQMMGVSQLQMFFSQIMMEGNAAKEAMSSHRETLSELLQEGAE